MTRAEAVSSIVRQYSRRWYPRTAARDRAAAEMVRSLRALGVTEAEMAKAIPPTGR